MLFLSLLTACQTWLSWTPRYYVGPRDNISNLEIYISSRPVNKGHVLLMWCLWRAWQISVQGQIELQTVVQSGILQTAPLCLYQCWQPWLNFWTVISYEKCNVCLCCQEYSSVSPWACLAVDVLLPLVVCWLLLELCWVASHQVSCGCTSLKALYQVTVNFCLICGTVTKSVSQSVTNA